MVELHTWVLLGGALLVLMALVSSAVDRWPVSGAMLYICVGIAVSPLGLAVSRLRLIDSASWLEIMTEAVVVISLFTCGLKLSAQRTARRWAAPVRLAVISMVLTVVAVSALGVLVLDLSAGASVLLAGILAPTDPVLASDVQVDNAADRDQLRFALTGEGGLNDGTAFPVVMLGLGLLGLHDIGDHSLRWLAIDVVWATVAGLGVGVVTGAATGYLVLYLRKQHREAVGYDNFLALGLIGVSYGVALHVNAYAFLAVFAAGVAVRRVERKDTAAAESTHAHVATPFDDFPNPALPPGEPAQQELRSGDAAAQLAVHPVHASAYMAHAMLSFNEQLDRIGEVCVVTVLGMFLWANQWTAAAFGFTGLLLFIIRPVSVFLGLLRSRVTPAQQRMMAWFGIRGMGSLYYLSYAISHGLDTGTATRLGSVTLTVVVSSIVLHGVSVTPLMTVYRAIGRQ